MTHAQSTEALAQELFDREWQKEQAGSGLLSRCRRCDTASARQVLAELVAITETDRNHSVREMESLVRERIEEQEFIDECGDSVVDEVRQREIDREVEVVLRVLEFVRRRSLKLGHWSDLPVTPVMFG